MSYKAHAYDDDSGQPVVVLVVSGLSDTGRFLMTAASRGPAPMELIVTAHRIRRMLKRHNGGKAALQLLTRHGGPDFESEDHVPPWHILVQDGPGGRRWQVEHPGECAALPDWACCWFDHNPRHHAWPDSPGRWRIRPAAEDFAAVQVQCFNEDLDAWVDFDGGCELVHADTGQEDRCDRRHLGAEQEKTGRRA